MNNRPVYRKMGNSNLFLAFSNASEGRYPLPWTMWGGPRSKPGGHVGNIKIGANGTLCPNKIRVNAYACFPPLHKALIVQKFSGHFLLLEIRVHLQQGPARKGKHVQGSLGVRGTGPTASEKAFSSSLISYMFLR